MQPNSSNGQLINLNRPAQQPVGSGATQQPEQQQSVQPKNPNSTQNALKFSELRDDMVIMGDGTFRAVVAAQSINFDLMSAREREGIEISYQDFLNALTFPIQVYIRSERVGHWPVSE